MIPFGTEDPRQRNLYTRLFEWPKEHGFCTAYAAMTLPNDKSIGLHKAFDFHEAGTFHKAGYKNGRWLDVLRPEEQLKAYAAPMREDV